MICSRHVRTELYIYIDRCEVYVVYGVYMWSINGVGLHVLPIVYVKYTWCVVCRPICTILCGVYMVYTCCQYVNFVWITWFMLSMLSVCLVYVVCVLSIRVYVVYVRCAWCMLNMHYVC